jgi:uncharacterized protein YfdQ (DUF2303 family)
MLAKEFAMSVGDGEKCWSLDEEQFNYESLDELIQGIYDLHGSVEPGWVVSFGTAHKPDAADFVDADRVIDDMGDAASDVGGEFAEDFPSVSPEARKELNDFLEAWARKHCEVTFFTVDNVQKYTITQADIDAADCK